MLGTVTKYQTGELDIHQGIYSPHSDGTTRNIFVEIPESTMKEIERLKETIRLHIIGVMKQNNIPPHF